LSASAVRIIGPKRIPHRRHVRWPKDTAASFGTRRRRCVDTILTVRQSSQCVFVRCRALSFLRKSLFLSLHFPGNQAGSSPVNPLPYLTIAKAGKLHLPRRVEGSRRVSPVRARRPSLCPLRSRCPYLAPQIKSRQANAGRDWTCYQFCYHQAQRVFASPL
jgi:hypothetical protein